MAIEPSYFSHSFSFDLTTTCTVLLNWKRCRNGVYFQNQGTEDAYVAFWPEATTDGERCGILVKAGQYVDFSTRGKMINQEIYGLTKSGTTKLVVIEY